jgi:hypothetical protein
MDIKSNSPRLYFILIREVSLEHVQPVGHNNANLSAPFLSCYHMKKIIELARAIM